ncbi:K02A2.6-like [Cordylochernes scorpioides]|uniref:K02A2.6-like n=1 Tax=Cordylochernes scorpioides TaxID=51811 RepID=A0ABY6KU10_9ARAC|nr:K02A2.6-like [Cordylochernes scorpioides]
MQLKEESISDYLVKIKRLASSCNFGNFLEDSLGDKMVCGLYNAKIQNRILSEGDISLAKVIEIALSMEAAEKNTKLFHLEQGEDCVDKLRMERKVESNSQNGKCKHCVPKKNNEIRICCDFKVTLNRYLDTAAYPLPSQQDLFFTLAKGKYFSKLDLRNAHLQLEVDPGTRPLLTINTHKGLFRFKRMPFGLANAPSYFKSVMDRAIDKCKNCITSERVLVPYDTTLPLCLATDASQIGVGAVLSHIIEGQERPIMFALRTLSGAERNYSQIEKKALAIIYGVTKFHQFIYGSKFILITDHKPLVTILGPRSGIPTLSTSRLQRWALILSAYTYDIKFRRTQDHGNADLLSRFPVGCEKIPRLNNVYALSYVEELPITAEEIATETEKDEVLSLAKFYTQQGWPEKVADHLRPYFQRKLELTVDGECLVWGMRVVIPPSLRIKILNCLHETHSGKIVGKKGTRVYTILIHGQVKAYHRDQIRKRWRNGEEDESGDGERQPEHSRGAGPSAIISEVVRDREVQSDTDDGKSLEPLRSLDPEAMREEGPVLRRNPPRVRRPPVRISATCESFIEHVIIPFAWAFYFISLRDGVKLSHIPAWLDIKSKGEVTHVYLTYGIKFSANCPLKKGLQEDKLVLPVNAPAAHTQAWNAPHVAASPPAATVVADPPPSDTEKAVGLTPSPPEIQGEIQVLEYLQEQRTMDER